MDIEKNFGHRRDISTTSLTFKIQESQRYYEVTYYGQLI